MVEVTNNNGDTRHIFTDHHTIHTDGGYKFVILGQGVKWFLPGNALTDFLGSKEDDNQTMLRELQKTYGINPDD